MYDAICVMARVGSEEQGRLEEYLLPLQAEKVIDARYVTASPPTKGFGAYYTVVVRNLNRFDEILAGVKRVVPSANPTPCTIHFRRTPRMNKAQIVEAVLLDEKFGDNVGNN